MVFHRSTKGLFGLAVAVKQAVVSCEKAKSRLVVKKLLWDWKPNTKDTVRPPRSGVGVGKVAGQSQWEELARSLTRRRHGRERNEPIHYNQWQVGNFHENLEATTGARRGEAVVTVVQAKSYFWLWLWVRAKSLSRSECLTKQNLNWYKHIKINFTPEKL